MFSENIINYLLHHYQIASIQGRQIQCRKDPMHVSHVEKNMVEESESLCPVGNTKSKFRQGLVPINSNSGSVLLSLALFITLNIKSLILSTYP